MSVQVWCSIGVWGRVAAVVDASAHEVRNPVSKRGNPGGYTEIIQNAAGNAAEYPERRNEK